MLIPVGSHPGWLYSTISTLRVDFTRIKIGTEIEIKKLEFMKLNTNRKE